MTHSALDDTFATAVHLPSLHLVGRFCWTLAASGRPRQPTPVLPSSALNERVWKCRGFSKEDLAGPTVVVRIDCGDAAGTQGSGLGGFSGRRNGAVRRRDGDAPGTQRDAQCAQAQLRWGAAAALPQQRCVCLHETSPLVSVTAAPRTCQTLRAHRQLADRLTGCASDGCVPDFTTKDTSALIPNSARLGGSSGRIEKTVPLGAWYDPAVSRNRPFP